MSRQTLLILVLVAALLLFGGTVIAPKVIQAVSSASEQDRLDALAPDVRAKVDALRQRLSELGIDTHVSQTIRTQTQEQAQIDAGHSSATLKVSWHQSGRAVDLYPIDPDTGKPDMKGARVDLFLRQAREAEALGFRQIAFNPDDSKRYVTGKNGPIWDAGHLEYHGPYANAQAALADYQSNSGVA
ncbi:MAG: hypothetical protein JO156_07095 [Solirubrobacterales bacterium]|nr:hypothetical protein [Solirubrobacterales bacterium]